MSNIWGFTGREKRGGDGGGGGAGAKGGDRRERCEGRKRGEGGEKGKGEGRGGGGGGVGGGVKRNCGGGGGGGGGRTVGKCKLQLRLCLWALVLVFFVGGVGFAQEEEEPLVNIMFLKQILREALNEDLAADRRDDYRRSDGKRSGNGRPARRALGKSSADDPLTGGLSFRKVDDYYIKLGYLTPGILPSAHWWRPRLSASVTLQSGKSWISFPPS